MRSTAELKRAAQTLCGFLNSNGGQVFIGVTPAGKIVGQQVADSTLQEIAVTLARFEPPAPASIERVRLEPRGDMVSFLGGTEMSWPMRWNELANALEWAGHRQRCGDPVVG